MNAESKEAHHNKIIEHIVKQDCTAPGFGRISDKRIYQEIEIHP